MNLDARQITVSPPVVPAIVALPAEIDISNAGDVGDELCAAFSPGVAVVIADMSRTVFCDTSGIVRLLIAHDLAGANQAELRLAAPSRAVVRVLQVTGVDRVLNIDPTMQAALSNTSVVPQEAISSPD